MISVQGDMKPATTPGFAKKFVSCIQNKVV